MEREEVNSLIRWLEVLSNGYVKPDANATLPKGGEKVNTNTTGIIRDTKDNKKYIDAVNKRLSDVFGLDMRKNINRREL